MNKRMKDGLERTVATAVEAGISYGITKVVPGMGPEWVLVLTPLAAAAKSWLAKFVGKSDSASFTKEI